jgi:formate hydrogenlyase subunit 3/multisubunit Na+/H+ antiporter MnhD subunit
MDEQKSMDAQKSADVKRNGVISEFAIASFVLGIFSFVTLIGLEKPIIGLVFGILALRRIAGIPEAKGKKLAIAGVALCAIAIIVIIILVAQNLPKIMQMQQQLSATMK